MTCTRVLILHQGRIRAADTLENLQRGSEQNGLVIAEISADQAELKSAFDAMADVRKIDISPVDGDFFRCALTPGTGCDLRPAIYDAAREHGWRLRELRRGRRSLEDIFVQVTRTEREEDGM